MNILVLCTGNSARSILLESILNHAGTGRVTAFSAGSQPAGRVHPQSLALLDEAGHSTANARSKSWDEFAGPQAPEMDVVITVCGSAAGETCPLWPGAPVRAHWGVDDPAAALPEQCAHAFQSAFTTLQKRADTLLGFAIETMDTAELQALLDRIGKIA